MIAFRLNGEDTIYSGDPEISLLSYLREVRFITSVKDGCSGQGSCGACLVEINRRAKLSCKSLVKNLAGTDIVTLEGIPENIKEILAIAFVKKGAVQCGFCTPGILMRAKILFNENPKPSRKEIRKSLSFNLCRCTGYNKIVEAIELASENIKNNTKVELDYLNSSVGLSYPKVGALESALGQRKFINDIRVDGMLFAVLKFSEFPRAKILKINIAKASALEGVVKIFTAGDIPGSTKVGLIFKDWPLMIGESDTTNYIGDVLAGIVATSLSIARKARELISVDYEVFDPITDVFDAVKEHSPQVHNGQSNILEKCFIRRGSNIEDIFGKSKFISTGNYQTQRIEHAFLETEGAIATPDGEEGLYMMVNSQGIYVDRRQIAELLNIPEEKIDIRLVPTGGGFGGKEDMTVQGHAALFAWVLKKPVKLVLTRQESVRMHPKRHPVYMDIKVAADENGFLTGIKLIAVGDTGAYASVGTKVMERIIGHTCGGYQIPAVDLEALTVYTNNIPSGAMRGFGVPQVNFALESCIDDICEKGNFDRWEFRYRNALVDGAMTATGQVLTNGVGIRATLEAVKNEFYQSKFTGLACGIKNIGVGNGMPDFSDVNIIIRSEKEIEIQHGWTEMGQGVDTIIVQIFTSETKIDPEKITVTVQTNAGLPTGMTTSSRATVLVGNAVRNGAIQLKKDLKTKKLKDLSGKVYKGSFRVDWTTKASEKVDHPVTHFAYGYASQLVVLNETGKIEKVIAAHDGGKIINPLLFEGQIEGAVHMGLGYALSEDLPMKNGFLITDELKSLGILKAKDMPEVIVKSVEVEDPVGPYGAKGVGEIGMVSTAAAVANALFQFDKIRRYSLPMKNNYQ